MSQIPVRYPPSPWQPPRPYVKPEPPPKRRTPFIHIVLFLATFITTSFQGALQTGANPFADPWSLRAGFPYALTLLTILLFHEFGHYFLAMAHRVSATLPFFLPAPPMFLPGTFGAFIRMRDLLPSRRALFDIGAAGPWAGLMISIPAFFIGMKLSDVQPLILDHGGMVFGESLMVKGLTWLALGTVGDNMSIVPHPIALAGWFGFLVTLLNLLPVGQLDGGHVVYAMFGRRHRWIARAAVLGIGGLAIFASPMWIAWVVIAMVLGVDHPPTVEDFVPLTGWRRAGGWLTILVFALIFMPVPVYMSETEDEIDGDRIPVHAERWIEVGPVRSMSLTLAICSAPPFDNTSGGLSQ